MSSDLSGEITAILIFRDAAGVTWTRKLDGELSELAASDPDRQTRDQRQANSPRG